MQRANALPLFGTKPVSVFSFNPFSGSVSKPVSAISFNPASASVSKPVSAISFNLASASVSNSLLNEISEKTLNVGIVAKKIDNLSAVGNFKAMVTKKITNEIKKFEITVDMMCAHIQSEEQDIELSKTIATLTDIFSNEAELVSQSKLCATNVKDAENALTKCFADVKVAKERKCAAETRCNGLEGIHDFMLEEYEQECREANQKMKQARIKFESQCTVGTDGKLYINLTPKLKRKRKVVKTWEKSVEVFKALKNENGPKLRSLNCGKISINEAKDKVRILNQDILVAKTHAQFKSKSLKQARNKAKVVNAMLAAARLRETNDVLFGWDAAPSVLRKRSAIEISVD
jgi:hypothetical protein